MSPRRPVSCRRCGSTGKSFCLCSWLLSNLVNLLCSPCCAVRLTALIVASSQLMTWFSVLMWSVIADLFCSDCDCLLILLVYLRPFCNSTCCVPDSARVGCQSRIYTVSKNDTDVAHYSFNTHKPILVIFGRDIAIEYAIKWWFAIPPLLTNVSALPGKHEHESRNCVFSVMRVLKTTVLWLAIFWTCINQF